MKIVLIQLFVILFSSTFAQTEIPTWFQGEWIGMIKQEFPGGEMEEYKVLIEHEKDYFKITSESFYYKCIGYWKIEESHDKEIIFIQEITSESEDNRCATDAKIRIYAKGGVVYYYTKGDVIGECTGVLTLNKKTPAEF